MKMTRQIMVNALLFTLLFLTSGCNAKQISTAPTTKATSAIKTTPSTSTSTSTSTIKSTVTSKTTTSKIASNQIVISNFNMLSNTFGWVLADHQLWKTVDGGAHWMNRSPKVLSSLQVPEAPLFVYFLNDKAGWLTYVEKNKMVVLHTMDGGNNWSRGEIDISKEDFIAVKSIVFINSKKGWLLTRSDASMGHTKKTLYATSNGGESWQVISSGAGYIPNTNATPQAIPEYGFNTGMSFRNQKTGWITLDNPIDSTIQLYQTKDAGHTWYLQKVDVPPIFQNENGFCRGYAPMFFGVKQNEGMLEVICQDKERHVYLYNTSDGGENWKLSVGQDGNWNVNQNWLTAPMSFVSEMQGWSFHEGKLMRTQDGGHTWSVIPTSNTLNKWEQEYPTMKRIQFTDASHGWILLSNTEGKTKFLQTSDAGKHWLHSYPLLIPAGG